MKLDWTVFFFLHHLLWYVCNLACVSHNIQVSKARENTEKQQQQASKE